MRSRARNYGRPVLLTLAAALALCGAWAWNVLGVHAAGLTVTGVAVSATEGTAFSGTVATFIDSGCVPGSGYTADIDWGDGTAHSSGTITPPPSGSPCSSTTFTVTGSHTYADEGLFTVTTTVSGTGDNFGDTGTGTSMATVSEGDLGSLIPTTITPTEGQPFSGSVGSFTDPGNPLQVASDFTASINWGDGTSSPADGHAVTVTGPTGGPFSINGTHTYADEGTFNIVASFSDDPPSTLMNIEIHSTANVAEGDALTAHAVTFAAVEGTAFSGTVATFTDTYAGNVAADFTATIDWGDGTTTPGAVTGGGGTFTVSAPVGGHTYADECTCTVKVTLHDDAPGTATAMATSTANVADADMLFPLGFLAGGTIIENESISGTVAEWCDSYSGQTASDFTGSFDWGDGTIYTTANGNVFIMPSSLGCFVLNVAGHAYVDEGTFTLHATLSDDAPGTATSTQTGTLTVTEADTLSGTGQNFTVQRAASTGIITVATFTDMGYPGNVATDFTATINWGDGTPPTTGTVVGQGPGGTAPFAIQGSHTYANPGSYTVTVTLSDDAPGTNNAMATATATVPNSVISCAANPSVLTPTDNLLHSVTVTLSGGGAFMLQSVTSNDPTMTAADFTFMPGTTYAAGTTSVTGSLRAVVGTGLHGRLYVLTFVPSGGPTGTSCQATVQVRLR